MTDAAVERPKPGRLVRRLGASRFDPGEHEVAWDGEDGAGQPVGTGIYFVRLEGGNGLAGTAKVLVAR